MTTEGTSRSPTLAELLRLAVEYHTHDLWTALPGKIDSFDPETQKANVKPLVMDLVATERGEEIAEVIPVIPDVQVIWARSGGMVSTLPVVVGDFCLLIFCARSIDQYLAGEGEDTNPQDFRTHDLADAVALMGMRPTSQAIADYDNEAAVWGVEGGTHIRAMPDKIELGIKDATQKVSVDSKVQTELTKLVNDLTLLKNAITAWIPVATDGGAALKAALAPWSASPLSVAPTNSELVTLEK